MEAKNKRGRSYELLVHVTDPPAVCINPLQPYAITDLFPGSL